MTKKVLGPLGARGNRNSVVNWSGTRRRTYKEGIWLTKAAMVELKRVMELILDEAIIRTKLEGKRQLNPKHIRRCNTCQRDQTMGALKL
jgi:hypothetical protein